MKDILQFSGSLLEWLMHALTNLPSQLALRKCQVAEMFSKQVAKQISLITLSQVSRRGEEGRGEEGREVIAEGSGRTSRPLSIQPLVHSAPSQQTLDSFSLPPSLPVARPQCAAQQ